MKLKGTKDHTYLITWLCTYYITAIAWAFCSGIMLTALRFFSRPDLQYTLLALIGTAIICTALSIAIYRVGKEMNKTSVPAPMQLIISDLVTAAIVFAAVSIILKNKYIINPEMSNFAKTLYGNGDPYYIR